MSLFDPIEQLKLSDTFYDWWTTTNEISTALNPLNIYDVAAGPGITVSRISGGVAVLSVNVGCGLKYNADVSLTLDIESLPEKTIPDEQDNYILELVNTTDTTSDTTDCEVFRRVEATNILPYTVSGDHDFIGGVSSLINISSDSFIVESPTVHFKTDSIRLGDVPSSDASLRSEIDSIGFKIEATDQDAIFAYRGDLLAWYTNQNIGISYDQAFVSETPSGATTAKFNFSPFGSTQVNSQINLLLGARTTEIVTTDTDAAITLSAINLTKALDVSYIDNAGTRTPLFYGKYDSSGGYVLFNVGGRIYIEEIENSQQFLTESDYTQYKVPLTNTNGVVDHKYVNRYVSASYDGSIVVGDVVRYNGTQFVKAQANSETNSQIFGVVERIDTGKIWIALTGIVETTGLVAGSTYYLSQVTAGAITSTKPTSGIVKPVLVAAAATKGMITSSSSASTPNFANVQITDGDLVDADSVGDTLTLTAGANVTIERSTDNEIVISAGSLSDADYWSTIEVDIGFDIVAPAANSTLSIVGEQGIRTASDGPDLKIIGNKGFSTVQIIGMNTDELDYTVEASVGEDTLYLRSGTGISITSDTNNDILIEAIGTSVPGDGSVTNTILADMEPFSIKGAQGNGRPVDIYYTGDHELYVGGYDTFYDTNGDLIFDDGVTQYVGIQSISGEGILTYGTPSEIAGYVFGRVVDTNGNVSEIKALGRTELRLILGANTSGFLEENSNAFNSWYLYQLDGTEINVQTADGKGGELVLVEGDNISLSRITGVGVDNKIGIRIDAANTSSGFQTIKNTRTDDFFTTSDSSGVIEIDDNDAIAVDVSTNSGLVFYIKPESITNDMLANMPANSLKAGINDTDNPNPVDLEIAENRIVGRLTGGNIKALTGAEARTILGLSSSTFFKTVNFYNAGATSATYTANSSTFETLTLKAGTNISFSENSANNITISAASGSSGGLNNVTFSATQQSFPNITTLTLDSQILVRNNDPSWTNIDVLPFSEQSGTLVKAAFDLSLMPQFSVKIAGTEKDTRYVGTARSVTGYVAENLVLAANEILCRPTGSSTLSGRTLSQIASETNGIPYFNTISNGIASDIAISSNGPKKLSIVAGARTVITPSFSSNTASFTIQSNTVLSSDLTPTLGADLNVSSFFFTKPNTSTGTSRVFGFDTGVSSGTNSRYLVAKASNTSSHPELKAADNGGSGAVNIILSPVGTGIIQIGGTLPTVFAAANSLNLGSGNSIPGTSTINVKSGFATEAVMSTENTSNSNAKDFILRLSADYNSSTYYRSSFKLRTKSGTTADHGDLVFTSNRVSATEFEYGIFSESASAGDLIIAAGASTNIFSNGVGSKNIKFKSDLMIDTTKAIKAVNNNITVDTVTNDFSGALVLKAQLKSSLYRVKSGSITQVAGAVPTGTGGMSGGYLDAIPTTTQEKANKYIMWIQNNTNPVDSAMVEFNVVINGSGTSAFRSLEIINTMVSNVGALYNVSEDNGGSGIVILQGEGPTGTTGGVSGQFSFNPSSCASAASGSGVLITLANCLIGQYNITLHKMSIQA